MNLKNSKIILAKKGSSMIPFICHSGKRKTIKKHFGPVAHRVWFGGKYSLKKSHKGTYVMMRWLLYKCIHLSNLLQFQFQLNLNAIVPEKYFTALIFLKI